MSADEAKAIVAVIETVDFPRVGHGVPAGLIENQDGVGAGGDLSCDLIEVELHGRGVAVGQDQAGTRAACRTDSAKYIGRAGALIVCQTRPATLAHPQIGELVLLSHPHLVLEPDFDGGGGVGVGADLRHLAGKVF